MPGLGEDLWRVLRWVRCGPCLLGANARVTNRPVRKKHSPLGEGWDEMSEGLQDGYFISVGVCARLKFLRGM